ncbi:hypothetical protein BCR43DRAFT_485197 [Syncephalastrum racemosum]|uniref:Uncharacterized protein n=1 Tax=Syncephalastrum racemosum TaxID=13706 RepID=A0A1X2HM38_SYNRA|nr:hypothetical protein BCR43DRAFT_485197 [Syncephalastrum racemosum]
MKRNHRCRPFPLRRQPLPQQTPPILAQLSPPMTIPPLKNVAADAVRCLSQTTSVSPSPFAIRAAVVYTRTIHAITALINKAKTVGAKTYSTRRLNMRFPHAKRPCTLSKEKKAAIWTLSSVTKLNTKPSSADSNHSLLHPLRPPPCAHRRFIITPLHRAQSVQSSRARRVHYIFCVYTSPAFYSSFCFSSFFFLLFPLLSLVRI